MSRFNQPTKATNRITNFAGGEAFAQSPKLELVSLLLTSFVQDQYYRTANDSIKRLNELVDAIADKKFAAKAAIYARNKFGMRSISHVTAAKIAASVKGEEWTKAFFNKIVFRPDDMSEILSLVKKPVPNALKKGFAEALARFDEYQIAKYKMEGKDVSLVDIVNLVHPKPTKAITALVNGTLKSAETWEKKLSEAGKAATEEEAEELKSAAWANLLKENKLGYFALLRNLRNILEQAPEVLDVALEQLTDKARIQKSLVLPFRFMTAAEQFEGYGDAKARKVLMGLAKAIELSMENVTRFDGETLVALDVSGSMNGRTAEIAGLFGAIIAKANNADVIRFDDRAEYFEYNPVDSVATIARRMMLSRGGTNFHAVFEEANKPYDRIIFLSDMQGWVNYNAPTASLAQYAKRVGKTPRIYSFDLAGHGQMQFPENNIFCIAGFSEKIFDVMKLLEQDRNALVKEIEKVEL